MLPACQPGPAGEDAKAQVKANLSCESLGEKDGMPQSAVYATAGEKKAKLATTNTCDSIPRAAYEDHEIPDSAIAAVGGWWAGLGEYFYAIREGEGIAYYKGWVEERQEEENYHYQKMGGYKDGRFEISMPLKKEELVGTYTLSKEEGSHIVFVGMRGDTLVAEYFQMEGILPPVNQLNIYMTSLESERIENLEVDPLTLHFTSSMGRGEFVKLGDGIAVIFLDKEIGGQPMMLAKVLAEDYSIPVEQ